MPSASTTSEPGGASLASAGESFPSRRDAAVFHEDGPGPALSLTPQGGQLLFHFIKRGIFVQRCRVSALAGDVLHVAHGLHKGEGLGAAPSQPPALTKQRGEINK